MLEIGSIVLFYAGASLPDNFLPCDGSVLDEADYPELAKHFTKEYGSTSYFDTNDEAFKLPDFPRGNLYAMKVKEESQ